MAVIHTTEWSQAAMAANPLAAPVHVAEWTLAQHTYQHATYDGFYTAELHLLCSVQL